MRWPAALAALALVTVGTVGTVVGLPDVARAAPGDNADRDAAQWSDAAASIHQIWESTGRPARLVVVGRSKVNAAINGQLVSRFGSSTTFSGLAGSLRSDWLSIDGGTATLRSTLVVSRGASLAIGPRTPRVLLADGVSIRVRGTFTITDAQLGAQHPTALGTRPFVQVTSGGRLDATRAVLHDLGRTGPAESSGVTWSKGARGSVVDTRFEHNAVGLTLAGSSGVRLTRVTASGALGDGVVLDGDHGTTATALRAERNGASGVRVAAGGDQGRRLVGVTARNNGTYGLSARGQQRLTVATLATDGNRGGGVRLLDCVACRVTGARSTGDGVAVTVGGSSRHVAVSDVDVSGGASGLVVTAPAHYVTAERVAVRNATGTGAAISASQVELRGTTVDGTPTGVRVYGHAVGVKIDRATVTGAHTGILVTGGTRDVRIARPRIAGVSGDGLSIGAAGTLVSAGRISDATTGISARAGIDVDGIVMSDVRQGFLVSRHATARLSHVDVLARKNGIKADDGTHVVLTDSRVRAPMALRGPVTMHGHNTTTLPPFPWLGLAAIAALVLAVTLETMHLLRQRRRRPAPGIIPDHVLNSA